MMYNKKFLLLFVCWELFIVVCLLGTIFLFWRVTVDCPQVSQWTDVPSMSTYTRVLHTAIRLASRRRFLSHFCLTSSSPIYVHSVSTSVPCGQLCPPYDKNNWHVVDELCILHSQKYAGKMSDCSTSATGIYISLTYIKPSSAVRFKTSSSAHGYRDREYRSCGTPQRPRVQLPTFPMSFPQLGEHTAVSMGRV